MNDTSLNRIYEAIGGLTSEVKGLRRDADEDRRVAADHRQGVREELSNIVLRQTHLETDVASLKNKVEAHEEVTVQIKTLRSKAEGAGTLGYWLIRIGIGVMTLAGWLIGAYTWLTGRPPP